MSKKLFDINDKKEVFLSRNCKNCLHYKVCKFVETNREMAKQNKMYEMNQYLESNNIQDVFEQYAKCMHYRIDRQSLDFIEGPVTVETKLDILYSIIHIELGKLLPKFLQYSLKDGIVEVLISFGNNAAGTKNEYVTYPVDQLIADYKII